MTQVTPVFGASKSMAKLPVLKKAFSTQSSEPDIFFGAKSPNRKGPMVRIAGALMAGLLSIGAVGCASQSVGENVTNENVFSITGTKSWSFANFDLKIHQTDTGWVVQGKKDWDLTGYKFEVDRTQDGWSARGSKDLSIGDYHFTMTPTATGFEIKGGEELAILGDFQFTATRTATGFDIEGKQQDDLFGKYKFRVTETTEGWRIQGGHNWDLSSFDFNVTQNKTTEGMTDADKEALAVSFPVILSMIHDAEQESD